MVGTELDLPEHIAHDPNMRSVVNVHDAARLLVMLLKAEKRPEKITAVWRALIGECEMIKPGTVGATRILMIFKLSDLEPYMEIILSRLKA